MKSNAFSDRNAKIQKDNMFLVKRMQRILTSKQVDDVNHVPKISLHETRRRKEREHIKRENRKLLERIINQPSTLRKKEWKKHAEKMARVAATHSRFRFTNKPGRYSLVSFWPDIFVPL